MAVKNYVLDTNVLLQERARVLRVRRQQRSLRFTSSRRLIRSRSILVRARAQRTPGGAAARLAPVQRRRPLARTADGERRPCAWPCRRTRFKNPATTRGPWILSASSRLRSRFARPIPVLPDGPRHEGHQHVASVATRARPAHHPLRSRADSTSTSSTRVTAELCSSPPGTIDSFYVYVLVVVDAPGLHANEYLTLKDENGKSALTRWDKTVGKSVPEAARSAAGDQAAQQGEALRARPAPRRLDQAGHARRQGRYRQDAPAIAAGLQKVTEDAALSKLLVSDLRSAATSATCRVPSWNPWMQPILRQPRAAPRHHQDRQEGRPQAGARRFLGDIDIEPLTYIRGRCCRTTT